MKSINEGHLRRVNIEDESVSEDGSDELGLDDLSEADLSDSEADLSQGSDDDEETATKQGLASISFGSLVQAQEALTSERKSSRDIRNGLPRTTKSDISGETRDRKDVRNGSKRKRESKHAPMEMSSKRPVGRTREVVETFKIDRRDPRFDPDTSNHSNNTGHISGKYKFLEEYKKDEMRILQESIKKEKDPAAKLKLEKTLGSMQSRLQAAKERERRQRVLSEFKNKERAAAKDGKIPFHLKESEKNKLYLKDKFESMKDTKGLDKFLEKKRKRRSQKDRKRALPI